MTSLVERLRYFQQYGLLDETPTTDELGRAADTIEAMRAALAQCEDVLLECADFVQPFNSGDELLGRIEAALEKVAQS